VIQSYQLERPTYQLERPVAGEKPPGNGDEIDLLAVARVLWRRKGLIIGTVLALTAVVAVVTLLLTPKYSASAYIMIDPGQTKIVDAVEAVVAGAMADAATIESEARVLQSRSLADRVIAKLDLEKNPEFNTSLAPPGILDPYVGPAKAALSNAVAAGKRWIGLGPQQIATEEDPERALRAQVIDNFLGDLDVSIDGRSRVIAATFSSQSPTTAAKVVNTLADLYIVAQLEAKYDAAKTASQWLNGRLTDLRQQVEASEAAAEKYRAEHGLIANKDVMISTQEATDVSAQLALAHSQRAEAEARLHEMQSVIDKPDGVAATAGVLNSGLIQNLREQEAEVQRKVSDLAAKLGPKHPDLTSAKAELAQIRAKIATEVGKIVEGLKNEVTAARARESSLSASLDSVKGQAGQQNQSEVKLRALDREATASRTLLETFLQRAQETNSQESYQQADAHIVSKADVPQNPTFPKKTLMVTAGFLASTIIGVLVALFFELTDQSFRSEEQLEQVLGLASFGLIPSLKHSWGKSKRASAYVVQHPASAYVEAMRNLYTGLRVSNGDHLPRTVLITSSLPNEGKTTVAASLASLLAAAGLKPIIVDTDLRKPTLHHALGIGLEPGLADHLLKALPLESVVQHDKATGIDAIAAGRTVANPPDLLGTDQMKQLLARLGETYDTVILDSAPLLAVSDARILVRMVDKIVFLVRWSDTSRNTALRGMNQIVAAGDNLAGTMLTMVDFEAYAKYRYGTFGQYYRRIEHYYAA